jgi:ribosome biogenesis GTPase A
LDVTDQEITPHKDYVTIGLVGHPNVGKSSLINSIMGRTVVSASRTPGHTKHFQTIHLTANVRLCDSPGLVFPSLLPKPLQILSGMYPIAQVQEPYSTIQYLVRKHRLQARTQIVMKTNVGLLLLLNQAERIPLEKILRLTPPDNNKDHAWSAWDICEEYAKDRGFFTAKAARPDVYRGK